jgi:hypothetical protein
VAAALAPRSKRTLLASMDPGEHQAVVDAGAQVGVEHGVPDEQERHRQLQAASDGAQVEGGERPVDPEGRAEHAVDEQRRRAPAALRQRGLDRPRRARAAGCRGRRAVKRTSSTVERAESQPAACR